MVKGDKEKDSGWALQRMLLLDVDINKYDTI